MGQLDAGDVVHPGLGLNRGQRIGGDGKVYRWMGSFCGVGVKWGFKGK